MKAPRYNFVLDMMGRIRKQDSRDHIAIMEVGTHRGDMAVEMGRRARKLFPNEKIHYYGFDLFEDLDEKTKKAEFCNKKAPPPMEEVRKRLVQDVKYDFIRLVKGNTLVTLPEILILNPFFMIDFLWLDGGHLASTIEHDWAECEKLFHERTVACLDDYYEERDDVGCRRLFVRLQEAAQAKPVPPETFIKHYHLERSVTQYDGKGKVTVSAVCAQPASSGASQSP